MLYYDILNNADAEAMKCPDCGLNNLAGVLLCEHCGADLYEALLERVATGNLKAFQTRELPSGAVAASSNPIVIYVNSSDSPLTIGRRRGIIIGRGAVDDGIDLDMTPYGGQNLGVSRRHARFDAHAEHLTLTDLNSTNGTFLNESRIPANQAVMLRSGDEVRIGRMVLRLYFK